MNTTFQSATTNTLQEMNNQISATQEQIQKLHQAVQETQQSLQRINDKMSMAQSLYVENIDSMHKIHEYFKRKTSDPPASNPRFRST